MRWLTAPHMCDVQVGSDPHDRTTKAVCADRPYVMSCEVPKEGGEKRPALANCHAEPEEEGQSQALLRRSSTRLLRVWRLQLITVQHMVMKSKVSAAVVTVQLCVILSREIRSARVFTSVLRQRM